MHSMLFEKLLAFVRLQGVAFVRAARGSAAPGSQLFSEMLSRIGGTFLAFRSSNLSLWHGNLIGSLSTKGVATAFNSQPVLQRWLSAFSRTIGCTLTKWLAPTSNTNPTPLIRHSAFSNSFHNGFLQLPPVLLANPSFNRTNCGGHRSALSAAIAPQFSG
jgi:hypothetical protein